ncbi:MAG: Tol-Pal system beta propeller repeat protein TolB [Gammaproteobacteria bacterium]|nr:Tol-Pal system beta propeller repeat protein TolB [Gammaproteobacteria bacterium]
MIKISVRRIVNGITILSLALAATWIGEARAVLTIKITQGLEGAQPIAIVPFATAQGAQPPPVNIAEVVANDLTRSGRFAPLPVADLPSRPSEESAVKFSDFRILGMPSLVIGRVKRLENGSFLIQFDLFDVFREKRLIPPWEFTSTPDSLRSVAHQISDIIYEQLTGERGAFNTSIAYVTEVRSGDDRKYALMVADSDGYNEREALSQKYPILSPSWSPDGGKLAYVSFDGARPRIYSQELATGARDELSSFPGLNSAPAWSPDGSRMALVLSKDGNPEIYILDIASRRLRRITSNSAIDTEPAWSPDGQWLVFTSDRPGKPQIYRVPATGGREERLTFEGTYNARATYSPDGKQLALVHGNKGAFRIAVLDLENGALRVLTNTTLDESPSFAPNGSMILYATSDAGGNTLAAVSTDGRVRQRLAVQQGDVREPAWSPFRKP